MKFLCHYKDINLNMLNKIIVKKLTYNSSFHGCNHCSKLHHIYRYNNSGEFITVCCFCNYTYIVEDPIKKLVDISIDLYIPNTILL